MPSDSGSSEFNSHQWFPVSTTEWCNKTILFLPSAKQFKPTNKDFVIRHNSLTFSFLPRNSFKPTTYTYIYVYREREVVELMLPTMMHSDVKTYWKQLIIHMWCQYTSSEVCFMCRSWGCGSITHTPERLATSGLQWYFFKYNNDLILITQCASFDVDVLSNTWSLLILEFLGMQVSA